MWNSSFSCPAGVRASSVQVSCERLSWVCVGWRTQPNLLTSPRSASGHLQLVRGFSRRFQWPHSPNKHQRFFLKANLNSTHKFLHSPIVYVGALIVQRSISFFCFFTNWRSRCVFNDCCVFAVLVFAGWLLISFLIRLMILVNEAPSFLISQMLLLVFTKTVNPV